MKSLLVLAFFGLSSLAPAYADVIPPACAGVPDGTACTEGSVTGHCSANECVADATPSDDDDDGCSGGAPLGLVGGLVGGLAGVALSGLILARRRRS